MTPKVKNLEDFKKNVGEKLEALEESSGSEGIKYKSKIELFREMVKDPQYQKLKKEFINKKKIKHIERKIEEREDIEDRGRDIVQPSLFQDQELNPELGSGGNGGSENTKVEKTKVEKTKEISILKPENFRINSNDENRKETTENGLKIKVHPRGDVWEYLEGKHEGEQFFTKEAARRETDKSGEELPSSWTVFRDMIDAEEGVTADERYQNFVKNNKIKYSGWRHPDGIFAASGEEFVMCCEDGSSFIGYDDGWGHDYTFNSKRGFSVRCVQA